MKQIYSYLLKTNLLTMFLISFVPSLLYLHTTYNVTWSGISLSNNCEDALITYTLTATNAASGGCGTCNSYLPIGTPEQIIFQNPQEGY